MAERRCVLLRHERCEHPHYDLMIEDPDRPAGEGALATWRIETPSWEWAAAGELPLDRIADHRRAYLSREGWLSGGRGYVRRVDEGTAIVQAWEADRATIELRLDRFIGTVRLQRLKGDRWRGRFEPGGDRSPDPDDEAR